jgi:transposase
MLGASSTSSSISWAAARRKAQRHAPQTISPIALGAVQRIDALSDIERSINGLSPDQRLAVRQEQSAPPDRRAGSLDA